MRDFPLIACGTGAYKAFGILLDGRPPKPSLKEFKCARLLELSVDIYGQA